MRIVFALGCAVLCTLFGDATARGLYSRVALLKALRRDVAAMSAWVGSRALPLREMLLRLKNSEIGELWSCMLGCLEQAESFAEGWTQTLKTLGPTLLSPLVSDAEAMRTLREFGEGLCVADEVEAQLRHLEGMQRRLEGHIEEARQEAAQKSRLYRSLAALGGLALAIVVV